MTASLEPPHVVQTAHAIHYEAVALARVQHLETTLAEKVEALGLASEVGKMILIRNEALSKASEC